jgi:hypothetical protein
MQALHEYQEQEDLNRCSDEPAAARVRARIWQVGFVVDKVARGRFSPSTSVSPANHISFHQLLHPHSHPGQVQ